MVLLSSQLTIKILFFLNIICKLEHKLIHHTFMALVKDLKQVGEKQMENGPYLTEIEGK